MYKRRLYLVRESSFEFLHLVGVTGVSWAGESAWALDLEQWNISHLISYNLHLNFLPSKVDPVNVRRSSNAKQGVLHQGRANLEYRSQELMFFFNMCVCALFGMCNMLRILKHASGA